MIYKTPVYCIFIPIFSMPNRMLSNVYLCNHFNDYFKDTSIKPYNQIKIGADSFTVTITLKYAAYFQNTQASKISEGLKRLGINNEVIDEETAKLISIIDI